MGLFADRTRAPFASANRFSDRANDRCPTTEELFGKREGENALAPDVCRLLLSSRYAAAGHGTV